MLSPVAPTSVRVPFGLKAGRMMTPAEVASGRACECVCPGCSLPLQARKGEQNVWHFAHDGRACSSGAETAIHLMAKQILASERSIRLPAVQVTLSGIDSFGRERTVTGVLAKPQHLRYATVDLEVAHMNRRADAIAVNELGTKHWIEVFVRHAVDLAKAQDLEEREYISYEICLDDVHAYTSFEQLRIAVIASPERVRWISYPGMAGLRKNLAEKLARMLESAERQKKADDGRVAQAFAAQVRTTSLERLGRGRQQREKARSEERIAQANHAFRIADEAAKRAYLRAKLRIPKGPHPALVNVEVRGEASFGVPRDVWQADVFRKWVFADGRRDVSLETVLDWLALRYEVTSVFPNSAKVAIWQYFRFLQQAGHVRHKGRQYFSVLRDVAPWLETVIAVSGSWFWAPGAYSCSLQELHAANDSAGTHLSTGILLEIFRRVRAEHSTKGQPDDAARTVAQRHEIHPDRVLAVLSAAHVASAPR